MADGFITSYKNSTFSDIPKNPGIYPLDWGDHDSIDTWTYGADLTTGFIYGENVTNVFLFELYSDRTSPYFSYLMLLPIRQLPCIIVGDSRQVWSAQGEITIHVQYGNTGGGLTSLNAQIGLWCPVYVNRYSCYLRLDVDWGSIPTADRPYYNLYPGLNETFIRISDRV